MEFRFPFTVFPAPQPVIALGGRRVRPRPFLPITLINPVTGSWCSYRGLLDTGADDTVFHVDTAQLLGIDLSNAPSTRAIGVSSGPSVIIRFAEVFLQIANSDGDVLEWSATVAFAEKRGSHPLLGFAGFLQFFDAAFLGEQEEFELSPNSLLPSHLPTVHLP